MQNARALEKLAAAHQSILAPHSQGIWLASIIPTADVVYTSNVIGCGGCGDGVVGFGYVSRREESLVEMKGSARLARGTKSEGCSGVIELANAIGRI